MDIIGGVRNIVGHAKGAISERTDKVLAATNKKEAERRELQSSLDDVYRRIGERVCELNTGLDDDQAAGLIAEAGRIASNISKIDAEIRQLSEAYALAEDIAGAAPVREEPEVEGEAQGETVSGEAPTGAACRSCGAELLEGSAFCLQCGAKIGGAAKSPAEGFCNSCGAKLHEGSAFCIECGAKV